MRQLCFFADKWGICPLPKGRLEVSHYILLKPSPPKKRTVTSPQAREWGLSFLGSLSPALLFSQKQSRFAFQITPIIFPVLSKCASREIFSFQAFYNRTRDYLSAACPSRRKDACFQKKGDLFDVAADKKRCALLREGINQVNSVCSPHQRRGNNRRNNNANKSFVFYSSGKNKGDNDKNRNRLKIVRSGCWGFTPQHLPLRIKPLYLKNQVNSKRRPFLGVFFAALLLNMGVIPPALSADNVSRNLSDDLSSPCLVAIQKYGIPQGVPAKVLYGIAKTESGFRPWALNVRGHSWIGKSRARLKHKIIALQKAGYKSFDVGCMQINYRWHGDRFETMDHMIDPNHNVYHASKFLLDLYREFGTWSKAVAAYHSRNPQRGQDYLRLVVRSLSTVRRSPVERQPLCPVASTTLAAFDAAVI